MDWKQAFERDPRFGGFVRQVSGRPSWPTRVGLLSAALVVIIPVLLILLAGLVVGLVVYFASSLVANVGSAFSGNPAGRFPPEGGDAVPGDDLRENVRVIQR